MQHGITKNNNPVVKTQDDWRKRRWVCVPVGGGFYSIRNT